MHDMAKTLLIVDDHPSFRGAARALLESEGFDVIGEADTGASGVEAALRLKPDIVLLDVQLPDTDGFQVARALMETDSRPVVILVSSRDASDYGELLEGAPARGFIAKAELTAAKVLAMAERS